MQSNDLTKIIAAAQNQKKANSTRISLYNFFIDRSISINNENMLREYSRRMSSHYLETFYDYPKIDKTPINSEMNSEMNLELKI